jgi:hypothetical protein
MTIPNMPGWGEKTLPYVLKSGGKTNFEVCSFCTDPTMGAGMYSMRKLDTDTFYENTHQWLDTKRNLKSIGEMSLMNLHAVVA